MNVDISQLTFTHRSSGVRAVSELSLRLRAGEALGLVGPNGAGKSTLLGCVLAHLRPQAGCVRIGGQPADSLAVRAATGSLSEKPAFSKGMTARGWLGFHHALLRRPSRPRAEEVAAMLHRVGLDSVAGRRPEALSHGMRQRLGLACALLGDPSLLILDEPATGLDPPGTALLRQEILRARERGATVILSSHQLDEVERTCGRIAFMNRGVLTRDEPLASLRDGTRVVRLRFEECADRQVAPGLVVALADAVAATGARLLDSVALTARVEVAGDAAAGALVAALAARSFPPVEITPEMSRLERAFMEASA